MVKNLRELDLIAKPLHIQSVGMRTSSDTRISQCIFLQAIHNLISNICLYQQLLVKLTVLIFVFFNEISEFIKKMSFLLM